MQNETRSCRCPKEHAEIWLSPPCDSESSDGRLWAADNPFDPCPECGAQAVRFVRADLVASDKPCDPADPCPTAYDLASERNTLDGLLSETKDCLDAALAQVARLRAALEIVVGCFDAAVIEGLYDRMAEQDNQDLGSLHDLIARRILHAEPVARAALAETADTPAPAPASDGWTKWEGGECPVADGVVVEVRCADGWNPVADYAQAFDWAADADYPIVAYRIEEARDA